MSFITRKVLLALFVCITIFVGGQVSEAVAVVDHKETKKKNIEILIPFIKKGGNAQAIENVNKVFDKTVNDRFADFTTFTEQEKEIIGDRYFFNSFYAVKFNNKDLFSMVFDTTQYTGGAHGMRWKDGVTANLATGKILNLGDLFKEGSGYEEFLNKKIKEQIINRGYDTDAISFTGVEYDTNYYLTGEMLVISYQPYDIAPYAYGLMEFYIDHRDLEDLYNENIVTALQ